MAEPTVPDPQPPRPNGLTADLRNRTVSLNTQQPLVVVLAVVVVAALAIYIIKDLGGSVKEVAQASRDSMHAIQEDIRREATEDQQARQAFRERQAANIKEFHEEIGKSDAQHKEIMQVLNWVRFYCADRQGEAPLPARTPAHQRNEPVWPQPGVPAPPPQP